MGLNATNAGNGSTFKYTPLEGGAYPARLVAVIDMGLQPQRPWQGQEKPPMQEIGLTYELTDEFMADEDGEPMLDKPRWISEFLPLHNINAEKAKSTKRYKALDPTGKFGGDFSALIGTPVLVTIVQSPVTKGKNAGRIYENVVDITSMRQKDAKQTPPLVNAPNVFDLDVLDMEVFNRLPKFIKAKIMANLNFNGSTLEAALANTSDAPPKQAAATEETLDDDVPY